MWRGSSQNQGGNPPARARQRYVWGWPLGGFCLQPRFALAGACVDRRAGANANLAPAALTFGPSDDLGWSPLPCSARLTPSPAFPPHNFPPDTITTMPTARPTTAGGAVPVPVSALPAWLRPAFPYRYFNLVQSDCFAAAYGSRAGLVVCAPTGSGKTGVLELALARQLADGGGPGGGGRAKAIYIAPTRALVQAKGGVGASEAAVWACPESHANTGSHPPSPSSRNASPTGTPACRPWALPLPS